ncbi:hypothetical protein CDAR_472341 [Caerostris darwini]|uniref:Uncharacterized protein n=1 Tax=Caerostris darwini TaxID=1538125 RepID=A0AAV4VP45_9ARAC|nr:hypothetical protein CDAR_472341 [Caerostris darwini]
MECILVPKGASQQNQLPCIRTLSSCLPEPGNPNSSKSISTFSEEPCFCLGSSTSSTHTERRRDIDRPTFLQNHDDVANKRVIYDHPFLDAHEGGRVEEKK